MPALGIEQGVILAAGRGSRMMPLSLQQPKPLLPVCNKPVMQYQLEAMRDAGVTEVIIVIGHLGDSIREYFGDGGQLGLKLRYVVDPEPQGIASSLARVEGAMRGPFALFLGDIFVALDDLGPAMRRMLERGAVGSVVVKREDDPEPVRRNFAVLCGADDRVTRVIEKPQDPPSLLKGVGIYLFTPDIFEAIRRTPRSALRGEYELTDAIQTLIDAGGPVYADALARWDINVTFPRDLITCSLRTLREQGIDSLFGEGARVGPEARVQQSVLGAGVMVDGPVHLRRSIILPGTRISPATGAPRLIDLSIVSEDMMHAVPAEEVPAW
jgi:dTDP-glucose pyrophosphorylase